VAGNTVWSHVACEFPLRCGNLANCYTLVTYLLTYIRPRCSQQQLAHSYKCTSAIGHSRSSDSKNHKIKIKIVYSVWHQCMPDSHNYNKIQITSTLRPRRIWHSNRVNNCGIRWYDRVRNEEVLQQTGLSLLSHRPSCRCIYVYAHAARLDDDTPHCHIKLAGAEGEFSQFWLLE